MVLFAEPAGAGGEWISWEVLIGCPILVICLLTALSIVIVRALRVRPSALCGDEADRLHWRHWGNLGRGMSCPYCDATPELSGFVIMDDGAGKPALDLMMQMPHLRTVKYAKCKKCEERYEWRWTPRGEGEEALHFEWRPGPPPAPAIPANATADERADWELWLRASAADTVEAYEGYLRDSQLRLFVAEAKTLLRLKQL